MRRRLLLGYLGLTLVVLVAFGVPLGAVWTSKLHADELSSLATSATDLAKGTAAPSPPLPTRIIPDDLEQALDNLVDNTLRVTPAGGSVRLSLHDEGAFVVLHVADDGPGMSAEDRAHAFDRFWSNRAERSTGRGLGLSIVDRLVRNMGGDVELRNAPGHGLDAIVRARKAR